MPLHLEHKQSGDQRDDQLMAIYYSEHMGQRCDPQRTTINPSVTTLTIEWVLFHPTTNLSRGMGLLKLYHVPNIPWLNKTNAEGGAAVAYIT
jgi:hypothetical protein